MPNAEQPPERALALALALADGRDVDWRVQESEAREAADLQLVKSLRLVSLLSAESRTGELSDAKRLGSYEILDRIGHGSNGEVFRAVDLTLNRVVALKLLRAPDSPGEPRRRIGNELLEEARRLASVKHPNVVTVYAAEAIDGRDAVSLEYVRGRTLAEILQHEGAFGPGDVARIGIDLCRALAAVHAAGLLHLDVKPENVMREEGGRVVLMDFGPNAATPMYMAPEVLRRETPTPRSDVYSLGVLLEFLATASFPFRAATIEDLEAVHRRGTMRNLGETFPQLPKALVATLEAARALDPRDRPGSMNEFEALLRGVGEADEVTAVVTRPAPKKVMPPVTTIRRRGVGRRVVGLAAVGAILAAGFLARELWPSKEDGKEGATRANEVAPVAAGELAGSTGEITPNTRGHAVDGAASSTAAAAYTIQAKFSRGADRPESLPHGGTVHVGDSLSVAIQTSQPVWLYLLNEDDQGHAYLLFPLDGLDRTNPLPAASRVELPGTRGGVPFYWQVTSATPRERIVVVASPEQLSGLEEDLLSVNRAREGRAVEYARVSEKARAQLRGIGGLVRKSPPPKAPNVPQSFSSFDDAPSLTAAEESVSGLWIRRVDWQSRP